MNKYQLKPPRIFGIEVEFIETLKQLPTKPIFEPWILPTKKQLNDQKGLLPMHKLPFYQAILHQLERKELCQKHENWIESIHCSDTIDFLVKQQFPKELIYQGIVGVTFLTESTKETLRFELDCVDINDVKRHYPALVLVELPGDKSKPFDLNVTIGNLKIKQNVQKVLNELLIKDIEY